MKIYNVILSLSRLRFFKSNTTLIKKFENNNIKCLLRLTQIFQIENEIVIIIIKIDSF